MTAFQSLKKGFGRIRQNKRLVIWLYLLNVVFAGVLVLPFRTVVEEVSKTDLGEAFVSGFSLDAYIDVAKEHSGTLESLGMAAVALGVLYVLVTVFVTGGVVASLASEERTTLRSLIASSGEYFLRYLRLFVFMLIAIGVLFGAHGALLGDTVDAWQKAGTTGRESTLIQVVDVGVIAFLASLILMVFDYARIKLVLEDRRSAFLAAWSAFAFAVKNPLRTTALFYINVVVVGVGGAVYLIVENQFSNATMGSVLGLLAVQQVLVIFRTLMRLSFYASQMSLYESVVLSPVAAPKRIPPMTPDPKPVGPPLTPTPAPSMPPAPTSADAIALDDHAS